MMWLFLWALYNAFPGAMLIAVVLFRIPWLEMRLNTGVIFFVLWGILTLTLMKWHRFSKRLLGPGGSLANLLFCGAVCAILLGWPRFGTVPAAIIREGLFQPRLPFFRVNAFLCAALLLGWTALFLRERRKH
jgi:hypothetical protein